MATVNSTQEEAEKTSQQGYIFQGQDSMLQSTSWSSTCLVILVLVYVNSDRSIYFGLLAEHMVVHGITVGLPSPAAMRERA